MSVQLKFGSFVFPAEFHPADDSLAMAVPFVKLPRAHGARQLSGYAEGKVVEVRGGIIKGPMDNSAWRPRVDALKAALQGVHNLYFETDRYYRCMQLRDFRHPFQPTGYGRLALDISIQFVGPDPRAFDTTSNTDTWSGPVPASTHYVVPGGNAFADPAISLVIGGAGVQVVDIRLTNNTQGKYFTISGTLNGGDIVVVDSLLKTVTVSGVDRMDLFEGEFFGLEAGSNQLQYDQTTGSISTISTVWQDRYW